MSGDQFLVSGDTSGAVLEKSAGSGDFPRTNFLAVGIKLKCQRGAGSSHYLAGMSGEKFLPNGDASGDD